MVKGDGSACTAMATSNGACGAHARARWTPELHNRFAAAVKKLGGAERAKPMGIKRLMGTSGELGLE
jgi:SHAQKYF class myb-like DNA-binding protein